MKSSLFNLSLASCYRESLNGVEVDQEDIAKGVKPATKTLQQLRSYYHFAKTRVPPRANRNFSKVPFAKLERITIDDMRINVRAKGSYLLLRTLEKLIHKKSIITIVEDHAGYVSLFEAFHMISMRFESGADEMLPVGTVFVLKEPQIRPDPIFEFVISCDSPSDVMVLERHEKLFRLAEDVDWKHSGKITKLQLPSTSKEWDARFRTLFESKKWRNAKNFKELELQFRPMEDPAILSQALVGLADVVLHLGCFEYCLELVKRAIEVDPGNLKAWSFAGRAHYHLRQPEEAKVYFDKRFAIDPFLNSRLEELKKCEVRMKEKRGDVTICELYTRTLTQPYRELDVGDYVGPIKVDYGARKGRRVIATENIKPGTLLAMAKSVVYAKEVARDVTKVPSLMLERNNAHQLELHDLTQEVCQIILRNPEVMGRQFYGLLKEGSRFSKNEPQLYCDELSKEPVLDVDKIQRITKMYSFPLDSFKQIIALKPKGNLDYGIFLFPSYFNHCCMPNAYWTTFKNVMFIYSKTHIKSGEEITISFIDGTTSYNIKEKYFEARNITCNCVLCELDRKEDERISTRRLELSMRAEKLHIKNINTELSKPDFEEWNKIIENIERTYIISGRREFQIDMTFPIVTMATGYSYSCPSKSISWLWKALWYLGIDCQVLGTWSRGKEFFDIKPHVVFTAYTACPILQLVDIYNKIGLVQEAKICLTGLYVAENALIGVDKKMFQYKYRYIPEGLL